MIVSLHSLKVRSRNGLFLTHLQKCKFFKVDFGTFLKRRPKCLWQKMHDFCHDVNLKYLGKHRLTLAIERPRIAVVAAAELDLDIALAGRHLDYFVIIDR